MQHNEANHKHSLRMCLASRFSRNQCCSSKAFYTCAQSLFLSESDSQLLNALVMVSFSPTLNCSMPFVMVPCGGMLPIRNCWMLVVAMVSSGGMLPTLNCSMLVVMVSSGGVLPTLNCSMLVVMVSLRGMLQMLFLMGLGGREERGGV